MRPGPRRFLWIAHRWVGLASALVFVVTAATGFALMFDRELNLRGAAPLARPSVGVSGLNTGLARAAAVEPGFVPVFLLPPNERRHAWIVFFTPRSGAEEPRRVISIDPDTGAVLSDRDYGATPAGVLLGLHMDLLGGGLGRAVVLLVSVGLALLSVSGFLILNRRLRTLVANPLKARGRWRALHRWTGLVGAALILMWSTTGFVLLGPSVLADARGAPKPIPVSAASLDAPLDTALTQPAVVREGEVFAVTLPIKTAPNLGVTILRRSAPPWSKFVTLDLDARTGAVTKRSPPEAEPTYDRVLRTSGSLHMGQFDPWPIHLAYLFCAVFPLLIVLTGPVAWIRRQRSERKRPCLTRRAK